MKLERAKQTSIPREISEFFDKTSGRSLIIKGGAGSGKTTFIKTLLGQLAPLGGQVQLGAALKVVG